MFLLEFHGNLARKKNLKNIYESRIFSYYLVLYFKRGLEKFLKKQIIFYIFFDFFNILVLKKIKNKKILF